LRSLTSIVVCALALAVAAPAVAQEPGERPAQGPEGKAQQGPEGKAQQAPEGGAPSAPAHEEEGGNFLVSPSLGLMLWTVLAFGLTLYVLQKMAFPRIAEALDKRRRAIEESIDASERARKEADELLEEYRARLSEAREQAEDIVTRARKAGDRVEVEAKEDAQEQREEMLGRARREIEAETRRALNEIRREVADLTVTATERITRKSLDPEDHKRLIEEALSDLDFAALAGDGASGGRESPDESGDTAGERKSGR
jgi:F-type H+-transporting ATPase subunit b